MPATKESTIEIPEIRKGRMFVHVIGTRPYIHNCMNSHAMEVLTLPPRKKNSAERQSTLKHDPMAEFRRSPIYLSDPSAPTLLAVMSSAFKGAMATAALDLPGTKKAQIGRLVYVEGDYTPIYGVPKLMASVVRSADMNRTPDVRFRAVLPRWACKVEITYVEPILKASSIINLVSAGGVTAGIGDWRPEKGKGDFGQYQIVRPDDPEYLSIVKGGRAEQEAAMENPEPYDSVTADLLKWFHDEVKARGFTVAEDEEEETEDA